MLFGERWRWRRKERESVSLITQENRLNKERIAFQFEKPKRESLYLDDDENRSVLLTVKLNSKRTDEQIKIIKLRKSAGALLLQTSEKRDDQSESDQQEQKQFKCSQIRSEVDCGLKRLLI